MVQCANQGGHRNRLCTAFWYMTDVLEVRRTLSLSPLAPASPLLRPCFAPSPDDDDDDD